ncbi:SHOCT domain-containing protein [Haloarchaeobius sp. HRN-SO-5]|uniref:SHOCT domain-containing protein n=1 Tax=Haloarchaeobius sp. HRN-SO-5 TaxID=3446118 RepID=UPI003EC01324
MYDPSEGDIFDKLPVLVLFLTLAVTIVGGAADASITGALAGLGFVVVLPLSFLFREELREAFGRTSRDTHEPVSSNDALDELKRRYARGELSDEDFERRTERIVENESLDDVRTRVRRERPSAGSVDGGSDREGDLERERDE